MGLTVPFFFSSCLTTRNSPSETMSIGCIGTGRMGRGDMRNVLQEGLDPALNARVVAVCDADADRAADAKAQVEEFYAENLPDAPRARVAIYSDYRDMLARSDIDGVTISTPDHWHAFNGIDAANAGKDIYIQKPISWSIEEGKALVRAVRKNRVILQTGSQQRSDARFRRACELVRNGRLSAPHAHPFHARLVAPSLATAAQPPRRKAHGQVSTDRLSWRFSSNPRKNSPARRFLHCATVCACFLSTVATLHAEFTFEETADHLTLREGKEAVLVFNHGEIQPPADGTPRSGYIHPLYAPGGDILTDDFPADHVHHRGVFFAWPSMTVMGNSVDVWHMKGIQPAFDKWGPRNADSKSATFEAQNLWRLSDNTPVVKEYLRYKVHSANETGRAIDVHATFTNLTEQPVTLKGSPTSAYGGLNVRMDGERPDVQITTAAGRLEGDANAIDPPSPWADHSSRPEADSPHSGVAIFQHPENPDFPARNWTLRPYGFLGATWPGESSHDIAAGDSLDLRYRLFVHRGTAEKAAVAERFNEWKNRRQDDEETQTRQ